MTVKINKVTKEISGFSLEEIGQQAGKEILLHGSVYKLRRMSGFAFVLLRTGRHVIQCVYSPEFSRFDMEELMEESCVRVRALVAAEERSRLGWELRLLELEVLSIPTEPMPIVINQKKVEASMEKQLDYRMLTLRNEKQRAIFKIQEGICEGFRHFLQSQNFTEIHSPKLVEAGAEGGANIFSLDYFGKQAYLAQSPQFYKQMMVGVFERVYEVGPVFRAEKHDTSRHLNEYTGVDFEMGYINSFEEIMEMEERMIQAALSHLETACAQELELLEVSMPRFAKEVSQSLQITLPPQKEYLPMGRIPRIRFAQAKALVAEHYHRPMSEKEDFEPEEENLLCQYIREHYGSAFVFVTHYPSAKRPFYAMDDPENPVETLSFDLLFRGLEITTGGQRIHSYPEQLEKLTQRGMNAEEFASYLLMHRHGMPPHGGLGLGLERFTARLLARENVRETCLFPRDIHRLTP
ncbi:MAG: aspartate--tRNA(Asn) ligase [Lachnospiraceae bacterium]|nr:aspartate--tRNA(Asn) ligase [Lachnospiraceae bacterium]